jgi:peroxiredoxin
MNSDTLRKLSGLLLALCLPLACSSGSQTIQAVEVSAGNVRFDISGTLTNPPTDTLRLYDFYGPDLREVAKQAIRREGVTAQFAFAGTAPSDGVFLLGFDRQRLIEVLIGPDRKVVLTADMASLPSSVVVSEGAANQSFRKMITLQYQYQGRLQGMMQQYQQAMAQNPQQANAIAAQMNALADTLYNTIAPFRQQAGLVGKLAAVYQHRPFNPTNPGPFADEMAHFKGTFLEGIDFADPTLGYMPVFYSKILQYVSTSLLAFRTPFAELKASLDPLLAKTPANSKARQVFLLAIINGCIQAAQQQNDAGKEGFVTYTEQYVAAFPNDALARQYGAELGRLTATRVGSVPPDIAMKGPDGQLRKLSELRGKVVLLDFWASWCRPCRMENPNVVRVYNQYHSRGFEVFSVSLDSDAARWQAAIQQDGLVWPHHVSDLQGWQNAAAQAYGVSSIPFALLLDRQGRIVATNLRGAALEQEVARLLNSN